MKVLQINSVYNQGSTGKITYDIHKYLQSRKIESIVCYGRGKKVNETNIYKVCGEFYSHINHVIANLRGIMYGNFYFSTKKIISIIKKENPDIVHLQCINCYFVNIYKLIAWLKENNIKTIITLHAEFIYTANCGHALECEKWKTGCGNCPRFKQETNSFFIDNTHKSWELMKKSFNGFNNNLIVVSVSHWLMERAKVSPILKDKKHEVILNGLDINIFHYYNVFDLKKEYENNIILFHVTPNFNNNINNIKGGYYIIELAKRLQDKNIKIVVAGDYDKNLKLPKNVILLGNISNQELLAKYYSLADITLLTSKRETFSMVTAESLCCGTPVVGFKAGAPEQIALREYSKFVEYGDVKSLYVGIKEILNKNINKKKLSNLAAKKYSNEIMGEEYLKLYNRLLSTGENDNEKSR